MVDIQKVLDCKMVRNDANAKTVKEYLKMLLFKVWDEEESFSGYRPFGNSGWKYEIYHSLIDSGIISGSYSFADDCYSDYDHNLADAMIAEVIFCL